MKPGDNVVCVLLDSNAIGVARLTLGKTYTVIKGYNPITDTIIVLDDKGLESQYYRHRFRSVKEIRKEKLKKLKLV